MKKGLFLVLIYLAASQVWGQKGTQFPVSEIEETLKEDADAIFRLHESHFSIESVDRAVLTERKVITIFNEDADYLGLVSRYYDKLIKITDFKAVVYDGDGKIIKKLKKDDIIDQSFISGYSLYDDNRIRGADLSQKTYPYTVDFSVTVLYKYLFNINDWEVLRYENVAVEKSSFKVSAPEALKPRFKLVNVPNEPIESTENGMTSYHWVFENLKAQEWEPYTNREFANNPQVKVSPTRFRYEGYAGDMSTWDGIAEWQFSLNAGRDDLSETAKREVKALVAEAGDDEEKIRKVYEYMQNRTRYVSIQLGIGGLQPFPASVVENNGYGDCKALSFYTQSLLKEVGIPSFYTWVHAGPNPPPIYRDFSDNFGNHVILCVPNKGDTIWLECTSQTAPMGYLGNFTGNRDVVIMTPEGGKIVSTPKYEGENNKYTTKGEITIDKNGNATSKIDINYKGLAASAGGLISILYQNEEDKKEWLRSYINLPSYELNEYSFSESKGRIPEVDLNLKLDIRKVASVSGNRLLLQPNLLSARSYVPKSLDRKMPISYDLSRHEIDSLNFALPEGSFVEQLPEKINISSDFGDYTAEFVKSEGKLTYIRTMRYKPGTYDSEKYDELIRFYKSIRRADRKKVIISVKT